MAKKASRRLVVDASVARSATLSEDPTATACRRFLDDILEICHKVVLTSEVKSEWDYAALQVHTKSDEVRVRFLRAWMVEMQSKGKILRPHVDPNAVLRAKINRMGLPQNSRREIIEDLHLLEAALAFDGIVISRDDSVHGLLRGISGNCPEISKVVWCNPVTIGIDATDWLRKGARVVKVWQLGSKRS